MTDAPRFVTPSGSLPPADLVRTPGPWVHRDVAAHGSRFHVVEAGEGPTVFFLHGFPTFWWTWRHQLTAIADAGFHVVAMDLRGYGGSDHTPHGYDPLTLAEDVGTVIRSLGEEHAVVVGHGWGGLIAWSMGVYEPEVTRAIAAVGMPHPKALRRAILRDRHQRKKSMYALGFQLPWAPEKSLTRDHAERVRDLLCEWSATPSWPDEATSDIYRTVFTLWPTAHCAIEYHRWALRSILRTDGIRYNSQMSTAIDVPVLQMHGAEDPAILVSSIEGSDHWVTGDYETTILPNLGHFPQEEDPDAFNAALIPWLRRVTA